MGRIRTFLAIEISTQLRRKAETVIKDLATSTNAVKWVGRDNLHLTLKFLGDIDDHRIYDVCQAAKMAAAQVSRFEVTCCGIGAFPTVARPRTIWLGIDDPDQNCVALHREIEQQTTALGIPGELRPYVPHLTIGRTRPGRQSLVSLTNRLARHENKEHGLITVEEVVAFSSELTPQGPEYHVLGRAPLAD